MDTADNEHKPLTDDQIAIISKRWTVKEPYFLAICERCGTVATSEIFGLDGETIYCPRCQSSKVEEVSQDRFPVLGLLATIEAQRDTIEGQSRLLARAETLFGKSVELLMVKDYRDFGDKSADFDAMLPAAWESVRAAAEAFDLAHAEYQTTGTVPCGECERRNAEPKLDPAWTLDVVKRLKGAESERDALIHERDAAIVRESDTLAENIDLSRQIEALRNASSGSSAPVVRLLNENADLRRQLADWQDERLRLITEKAEALAERDALASALEEARNLLHDAIDKVPEGYEILRDRMDKARWGSNDSAHHAERVRLMAEVVEAVRGYFNATSPTIDATVHDVLTAIWALDAHERKEQE